MAKVIGLNETLKAFKKMRSTSGEPRRALKAALYEMGLRVMAQSKKETPVDTGRLRGSGYVQPPIDSRNGPTMELGFGTDYALFVHEDLEAHHSVGKAKFLIDPINRMRSKWEQTMADIMKRHLRSGRASVKRSQPTSPDSGGRG